MIDVVKDVERVKHVGHEWLLMKLIIPKLVVKYTRV